LGLQSRVVYLQPSLTVESIIPCPVEIHTIWHTPVVLQFHYDNTLATLSDYTLSNWRRMRPCV
jgi:hypothetical protein